MQFCNILKGYVPILEIPLQQENIALVVYIDILAKKSYYSLVVILLKGCFLMLVIKEGLLYFLSMLLQFLILILAIYFFSISIVGWIKRKEKPASSFKPTKKFAMVVAAHNEEIVISELVDSLKNIKYPNELYDIFVVADNCTDKTADIAQDHGAIVLRRFNKIEKGKGFALEWAFDKIFKMEKKYDAFCIFDADNLVDPRFLMEMNKRMLEGYRVIQGYIDSKNPFDSWITASYSIAFWTANRLYQLPRSYLHMSCGLCGTGFCVDSELIREMGWGATCLTEDLEFTMKLALRGIYVGWSHDAIVYDEKPLTLKQSWNQRIRWMQGYADCTGRFFFQLMHKAIKEKNLVAFDCATYLLQPLRIIVYGIVTILAYMQFFDPQGGIFQMNYISPNYVWMVFLVAQFLYGPLIIMSERRFNLKVLFAYLVYPFYNLTWVPITIVGMLHSDKKEWSHTAHTRKINMNEISNNIQAETKSSAS